MAVGTADSPAEHRQADSRLHLAIASLTGSPSWWTRSPASRRDLHDMLIAIPVLPVNIEHSNRQHAEIVDAILHGNARRARRVMESHCDDTAALLRGLLGERRIDAMTELRNDRHLSVHDLRRRINEGDIDTVVVAFTDMQGRLQGKRMHGVYFADHVLEHGTEGCNYLLAVDIDMNTVDGYAISSWDRGYGDMEFVLDPQTIRLLPHQPGAAMVQCDLVWLDHTPGPAVAPDDPEDPAGPGRPTAGSSRWPGPSSSSSPSTPATRTPANRTTATWSRSTSTTSTTRSWAAAEPSRCCGRSATPVRRRAGRRVGQGRVQLRPARDRIPLRRRADHRGQPRRLQDDGQGDRRPAGPGRSPSWPSTTSARAAPATSTCRCAGPTVPPSSGLTIGAPRSTTPSSPGCWPRWPTSPCCTHPTSTPTSASRRAASRRPRSPGARTTGPARSGWSATAPAPGWRTGCPAPTSTPTSPWRRCWPEACTASRTSSSWVPS